MHIFRVGPFKSKTWIRSINTEKMKLCGLWLVQVLLNTSSQLIHFQMKLFFFSLLRAPSHLSEVCFPSIAFQIVPVFVPLTMAHSPPLKDDCWALPVSTLLSSFPNQTWYSSEWSFSRVLKQNDWIAVFKVKVTVRIYLLKKWLSRVFWTVAPFGTQFDLMIHHHELEHV